MVLLCSSVLNIIKNFTLTVDSYARSEFKIRPSDSDDLSRLFLKLVRSEHLEIYRVVLNHLSKKLIIQQQ